MRRVLATALEVTGLAVYAMAAVVGGALMYAASMVRTRTHRS